MRLLPDEEMKGLASEYLAQFKTMDWDALKQRCKEEGRAQIGRQRDLWPRPTTTDEGEPDPRYFIWVMMGAQYVELIHNLAWSAAEDESGALCFWVQPLPPKRKRVRTRAHSRF